MSEQRDAAHLRQGTGQQVADVQRVACQRHGLPMDQDFRPVAKAGEPAVHALRIDRRDIARDPIPRRQQQKPIKMRQQQFRRGLGRRRMVMVEQNGEAAARTRRVEQRSDRAA